MKNKGKAVLIIMLSIVASVLLYFAIWGWFQIDGNISNGNGLQKNDWLGFFGNFLAFIGTVILGAVAVWQNKKANETAEQANDLSKKLLAIEIANNRPKFMIISNVTLELLNELFDLDQWNTGTELKGIFGFNTDSLCQNYLMFKINFKIKNISTNQAYQLTINDLFFQHNTPGEHFSFHSSTPVDIESNGDIETEILIYFHNHYEIPNNVQEQYLLFKERPFVNMGFSLNCNSDTECLQQMMGVTLSPPDIRDTIYHYELNKPLCNIGKPRPIKK